jgi:hypothetical protein
VAKAFGTTETLVELDEALCQPGQRCPRSPADLHRDICAANRRTRTRRSPTFCVVLATNQRGAQDILRRARLRAGDDRVGVRPVQIAEADAVVGYPGDPLLCRQERQPPIL